MYSVLASPVDSVLDNRGYGKSYNILNNLESADFDVEAFVGRNNTEVTCENVNVVSLNSDTQLEYILDTYSRVYERLRADEVDIYHHMHLSFRWFNPLLVAGAAEDVPVLIGPVQAGHEVMPEGFKTLLDKSLGINVPKSVSDPLYRFVRAGRSALDPFRIELYRRTLQRADRIVAVHQEAKDHVSKFVDESKIDIVPLGVDPNEFTFRERRRTTNLVTIGELKRRKGFDLLLGAMERVVATVPDVHLHVFGKGPMRSKLEKQARESGIAGNVTFHGFVSQNILREHLADARAFVHPSRSESFSLVRLEAMATGVPAIVTDTSGAAEMVRNGTDGYVLPKENVQALEESILTLLTDFDLAQSMGKSAREHVETRYDWRDIGRQYVEIYQDLI